MIKKLIFLTSFIAIFLTGKAQNINNVFANFTKTKNSVSTNLSFDPAFFWGISYQRSFDVNIAGIERRLNLQTGFKTYQFNYTDIHINLNSLLLNNAHKFNIITNIGIENKYQENLIHQANVYNFFMSFMPAYFLEKWYIGSELAVKTTLGARFEHTDYYKQIYPEVQDGWYRYDNTFLYISLNAGYRFSDRTDLDFRVGYRISGDFENYAPYLIPYFGNLSFNYRF